jgi:glutamine synthetase
LLNDPSVAQAGLTTDEYSAQMEVVKTLSANINGAAHGVTKMTEVRRAANKLEGIEEQATAYCNEVKPIMDEIRTFCDRLEYLVEDAAWPLPKYREMFYLR